MAFPQIVPFVPRAAHVRTHGRRQLPAHAGDYRQPVIQRTAHQRMILRRVQPHAHAAGGQRRCQRRSLRFVDLPGDASRKGQHIATLALHLLAMLGFHIAQGHCVPCDRALKPLWQTRLRQSAAHLRGLAAGQQQRRRLGVSGFVPELPAHLCIKGFLAPGHGAHFLRGHLVDQASPEPFALGLILSADGSADLRRMDAGLGIAGRAIAYRRIPHQAEPHVIILRGALFFVKQAIAVEQTAGNQRRTAVDGSMEHREQRTFQLFLCITFSDDIFFHHSFVGKVGIIAEDDGLRGIAPLKARHLMCDFIWKVQIVMAEPRKIFALHLANTLVQRRGHAAVLFCDITNAISV